jgi:hypothetical protein
MTDENRMTEMSIKNDSIPSARQLRISVAGKKKKKKEKKQR